MRKGGTRRAGPRIRGAAGRGIRRPFTSGAAEAWTGLKGAPADAGGLATLPIDCPILPQLSDTLRCAVQLRASASHPASSLRNASSESPLVLWRRRRTLRRCAMATRPSWEGHLTFNLISIAVKAFNAVGAGGGKIGFHLL